MSLFKAPPETQYLSIVSVSYIVCDGTFFAQELSMKRCFYFFITVVFALLGSKELCAAVLSSGYTNNIQEEKNQHFYEIFLFSYPNLEKKNLRDLIFNADLSREFKQKYIEKFGTVDMEALTYRDSRYAEMWDTRVDPQAQLINSQKRKEFAEFMVKRLSEWHIDNYVKSEPQMKVIYETKEQISHAEVAITPESKFDVQYSLAGNTLDLNYINPYADSKLTVYMDPRAFGPSGVKENRLFLGKQIDKKNRINTILMEKDGFATFEYIRVLFHNLHGGISSASWYKKEGYSPRETRTSIGISHSF